MAGFRRGKGYSYGAVSDTKRSRNGGSLKAGVNRIVSWSNAVRTIDGTNHILAPRRLSTCLSMAVPQTVIYVLLFQQ